MTSFLLAVCCNNSEHMLSYFFFYLIISLWSFCNFFPREANLDPFHSNMGFLIFSEQKKDASSRKNAFFFLIWLKLQQFRENSCFSQLIESHQRSTCLGEGLYFSIWAFSVYFGQMTWVRYCYPQNFLKNESEIQFLKMFVSFLSFSVNFVQTHLANFKPIIFTGRLLGHRYVFPAFSSFLDL